MLRLATKRARKQPFSIAVPMAYCRRLIKVSRLASTVVARQPTTFAPVLQIASLFLPDLISQPTCSKFNLFPIPSYTHSSSCSCRQKPMQPATCNGIRVRTTADCNVIFYAVSLGILPLVSRRLSIDERRAIQSGCVFVWEERSPTIEAVGVRAT